MLFNSLTFVVFFVVVVTALLEHSFVAGAEKSARRSQLHFLRRLEPAVRCALVRDHRDGFLAWPPNG